MTDRRFWQRTWLERALGIGWQVYQWFPSDGRRLVEGEWFDAAWVVNKRAERALLVVRCGEDVVRVLPATLPGDATASVVQLEARAMSFLKKAITATQNSRKQVAAQAVDWVADHPALWEYMTAEQWEDGTQRETAMLLCFAEDGRFKICLQDRAQARSLWVTSDTIEGGIALLEGHLQHDTGDWRAAKGGAGRPSNKKSR